MFMQDKAVCFVSAFVFASSGLTASLPQNRSAGALREAPEVRLYPVSASRGGCAARTHVQARASRDEPSVPVEGGGGSAPRGVRAWTLRVPRQHGWGSFSQDGREGMALPGRGWNCGRGRPFRRFHTSPPHSGSGLGCKVWGPKVPAQPFPTRAASWRSRLPGAPRGRWKTETRTGSRCLEPFASTRCVRGVVSGGTRVPIADPPRPTAPRPLGPHLPHQPAWQTRNWWWCLEPQVSEREPSPRSLGGVPRVGERVLEGGSCVSDP